MTRTAGHYQPDAAQYYYCDSGETQRRIKSGDSVQYNAGTAVYGATVLTVGRHKILIQYSTRHRGASVQMVKWCDAANLIFIREAPIL